MEELTVRDYLGILVRRRGIALLAALGAFAFAVTVAFVWPPKYRSTATIQIIQPDIPQGVLESPTDVSRVVQAFADQRIQQIDEKITATSNLVEIISKMHLYPELRDTTPIVGVVSRMQKAIHLGLLSADLANPTAAARLDPGQLAAIAFTISFDYPDPLVAQEVDNELVTRFLDEDLRIRRQQAAATSAFLADQIATLEASMSQQEAKMSDFLAKHAGEREEDLSFNMQMAAQTAAEVDSLSQQLNNLNQQRASIEQGLSTTQANSVGVSEGTLLISPAMQLKSLQAKYATLTSQYGVNHPDVIALKRQIGGLQASISQSGGANAAKVKEADNPAFLVLQSEARSLDGQIKVLQSQQADARRQHETYARRVAETPSVTRDFSILSRDHDNAELRYRELKEKKMVADMSEKLEQGRKGERLSVVEPPDLPSAPHMPPRKIVLALGVLLAMGSGVGGALLSENLSGAVRNPAHLAALLGAPPLVALPPIVSKADRRMTRRRMLRNAFITVAVIAVVLTLYNFFIMPLDVQWTLLMMKMPNL